MPALTSDQVPDVQVFDEASQPAALHSMLAKMGGGPVVILPVFTRCSASCPVLTQKLETAIAGIKLNERYRVIVFSFDPLETAESLSVYRVHEHIPYAWKIVRSNENEIRRFFGFFHYPIMNQNGSLVHPNEIFILDESLSWRWTLVGDDWSSSDLAAAIEMARRPGLFRWMKSSPDVLAWVGFAAMMLGLGIIMARLIWRKPSAPPLAV